MVMKDAVPPLTHYPGACAELLFLKVNNIQYMIPEDQNVTMKSHRDMFMEYRDVYVPI